MKPLTIEVTATLAIEPAQVEKLLAALEARVAGALAARNASRPPALPASPPKAAADFLSAAQLARRWQMHAESIRRMIREKRLQATRFGRRLRISLAEVERLEREGRTRPGP